MRFSYRPYWAADGKVTLHTDDIFLEHFYKEDFIYRKVARRKVFYENDLLFYLAYAATRGGIYVDVGANIGNHSIFFAKYLADFVISIEPSARLREQLVQNMAGNDLKNNLIIGAAIGKERAAGRLMIPEGHANNFGMGTIATTGDQGEPVEIYPLEAILEEYRTQIPEKRITLIKIDVEGMGPEVLEGCRGVLAEHHPQVVIEAETDREYRAIVSLLEPLGYRQVAQFCATPTYLFVNPAIDNPPKQWVKFRAMNLVRIVDEKLKRMLRKFG